MKRITIIIFILFSWGHPCFSHPVDITSDQGVECDHKNNVCRASGRVVMTQGGIRILAHQAKASFTKTAERMEIKSLNLSGDVRFFGEDGAEAQSEYAFYDVVKNKVVLKSGGQDKVILIKNDQHFTGDKVTFFLTEKNQKKVLKVIHAHGHAILQTPDEKVTSHQVMYDPQTQIAQAWGHVKIIDKKGVATGHFLETNFLTKKTVLKKTRPGQQRPSIYIPSTQHEGSVAKN